MATYISNAFSAQMLGRELTGTVRPVSLARVRHLLGRRDAAGETVTSCVGHADVAAVISAQLGRAVAANRVSVALRRGDVLLIGQYVGPRLPEGATALPEGAEIGWYEVRTSRRAAI